MAYERQFVDINQSGSGNYAQNKYVSSCREIKRGVSYGSIYGPVLFSLYLNDLSIGIQGAKFVLFLGATNLLFAERDHSALQHKIKNVIWFYKINLMINTIKTVEISFHVRHSRNLENPRPCL